MILLVLKIIIALFAIALVAFIICVIFWMYALFNLSKKMTGEANVLVVDAKQLSSELKNCRTTGAKAGVVARSFKKTALRWFTI
jgi:hypothetical protein